MSRPTVAVVGASRDRSKFGNKAVRAYRDAGFQVYPVNPFASQVEGIAAYPSLDALPVRSLDRVSLYVPPEIGLAVLDQVAGMEVGEVWLNPGADSFELIEKAEALGLPVVRACSLIALGRPPDSI